MRQPMTKRGGGMPELGTESDVPTPAEPNTTVERNENGQLVKVTFLKPEGSGEQSEEDIARARTRALADLAGFNRRRG